VGTYSVIFLQKGGDRINKIITGFTLLFAVLFSALSSGTPAFAYSPSGTAPTLLTQSLPSGWSNHEYIATVRARDADLGDTLSMAALGLPEGRTLANCRQFVLSESERLHCDLVGRPAAPGTYTIKIGVFDNHGNTGTRLFPVEITVQPGS